MKDKTYHVVNCDAGGCNGCVLEIFSTLTHAYGLHKMDYEYVSGAEDATIMLVQGCGNKKNIPRLLKTYNKMPKKKAVVAIGSCAISGGVFANAYNFAGPIDKHVHVDVYVPGCPPRPEAIIDGLMKAGKILRHKK